MSESLHFRDRIDAGRQLGRRLEHLEAENPIVLGLPRGGVVVGYEIAQALSAPLDVVVARKLGAPQQPELGIGAVAPGGVMLLDDATVAALSLGEQAIEEVAREERREMARRLEHYRGTDEPADVRDRTVIIADDGLATGVTALAAVHSVRKGEPRRIVLAIPVCARSTAAWIAKEVDELICLSQPRHFAAVGFWYEYFEQTTDAEVIELLEEARDAADPDSIKEP